MRQRKNTALPAGTLSITLKAKQLKLVVPILIELKKWLWEKTFQLRALKNSSKNLTFQKEKELFLRGKYIFFSLHSINSSRRSSVWRSSDHTVYQTVPTPFTITIFSSNCSIPERENSGSLCTGPKKNSNKKPMAPIVFGGFVN